MTVAALAEEPGTEKGDALSWSMFRRGITGDVQIYNDYTLEMTGIYVLGLAFHAGVF